MEADLKHPGTASTEHAQTLGKMTTEGQSRAMRKLWERMAAIYGADRWERSYGSQPAAVWLSVLGPRTLDDLARGIGRAEQDTSGRIPTLGEFSAWCREYQPGTFAGASKPPPPLPGLAQLEGRNRTATGKLWFAFMRHEGIIGMGNETPESVAEALRGADIEAMRRRVEREEHAARARVAR